MSCCCAGIIVGKQDQSHQANSAAETGLETSTPYAASETATRAERATRTADRMDVAKEEESATLAIIILIIGT